MNNKIFKLILSVCMAMIFAFSAFTMAEPLHSSAASNYYYANVAGQLYNSSKQSLNRSSFNYSHDTYSSIVVGNKQMGTVSYSGSNYWTVKISSNPYTYSRFMTIYGIRKSDGKKVVLDNVTQEGVTLSVSVNPNRKKISALPSQRGSEDIVTFTVDSNSSISFSQVKNGYIHVNDQYVTGSYYGKAADYGKKTTYTVRYEFPNNITASGKSKLHYITICAMSANVTTPIEQLPLKYELQTTKNADKAPFQSITLTSNNCTDSLFQITSSGNTLESFNYYGALSDFTPKVNGSIVANAKYGNVRMNQNGIAFVDVAGSAAGDSTAYSKIWNHSFSYNNTMTTFTVGYNGGLFGTKLYYTYALVTP